jgi:hypothetical protein
VFADVTYIGLVAQLMRRHWIAGTYLLVLAYGAGFLYLVINPIKISP